MLLPFMDGLAKHLSNEMHFMQVVWGTIFFYGFNKFTVLHYFYFRKHLKWPNEY